MDLVVEDPEGPFHDEKSPPPLEKELLCGTVECGWDGCGERGLVVFDGDFCGERGGKED